MLILYSTVSNLLLKKLSYPNRRKITSMITKWRQKVQNFTFHHIQLLLSKTTGIKRQDIHLFKHYVVGKIHLMMNQHSGFPLLASSNYSRRKRKYWFNLGTDVSYNMYTNFVSHRLWCIHFGSLVSNLYRNHLSVAVLTLWVAPPKMFGSIVGLGEG